MDNLGMESFNCPHDSESSALASVQYSHNTENVKNVTSFPSKYLIFDRPWPATTPTQVNQLCITQLCMLELSVHTYTMYVGKDWQINRLV